MTISLAWDWQIERKRELLCAHSWATGWSSKMHITASKSDRACTVKGAWGNVVTAPRRIQQEPQWEWDCACNGHKHQWLQEHFSQRVMDTFQPPLMHLLISLEHWHYPDGWSFWALVNLHTNINEPQQTQEISGFDREKIRHGLDQFILERWDE